MAARIERGDIRMYQYRGAGKKRPVLVLTRHGTIRHLSKVTIAPITSSVRAVPSDGCPRRRRRNEEEVCC